MAQAVVARLATRKGRASVTTKRVRSGAGKLTQFFLVDGSDATLGDDLTYVFKRNIERARKENRKLFGSADGRRKK